MTVRTPDSGFEAVERRYERLERFIPFMLLAVPLVPYVLSQNPAAGAVGITAGIAAATVKTHVLHIYGKLGVNDRAAAVAVGFERGLLPRP